MGEPIVEWLNQQQDNMVELLRDLVDIDSNSFNTVSYTHLTLPTTPYV